MKIKPMVILLLMVCLNLGLIQAQSDQEIFDRAKFEIFDKQWHQALQGLNRLIADYPQSRYYAVAHFYKGKCLEELKRVKDAIKSYHTFIKLSENESLKEEAVIFIIALNFKLYEKGEKQYLEEVVDYLKSSSLNVQYYTAIKLSYARDKKVAARGVPVLKKIIARETDRELVDRARIALMRIDPDYLRSLARTRSVERSTLHIKVYDKQAKSSSFSINIPFGLARLALEAIPEREKNLLKKKGYDLDRILEDLTRTGEIFKIESEETVIRIWID